MPHPVYWNLSFRSIKICVPCSSAENDGRPGNQNKRPAVDNWKKHPVICDTQVTFCHAMLLSKILTKIINMTVPEHGITNVMQFFDSIINQLYFTTNYKQWQ
jgi:hypothetical protein